jgi:hypothetical protein
LATIGGLGTSSGEIAVDRRSVIKAGRYFSGGTAMARGGWVYVAARAGNKPWAGEKSVITTACAKFIAEVLKSRFLPKIRPTKFNYPIVICGKWHGNNKYRFITRYRPTTHSYEPGFEAPFARILPTVLVGWVRCSKTENSRNVSKFYLRVSDK